MAILETKHLSFTYRGKYQERIILEDVSMSFEKGRFYTILGSSGSGKTTFLSLLASLETIQKGDILYQGKSLKTIDESNYRSHEIAIIFQDYNLIPYLSGYQNILLAMDINKSGQHNIDTYLDKVGIDHDTASKKVTYLSGGEQQRIAIARALSTNAKIIFADEPTGNLDKKSGQVIIEMLKKLAHEDQKCVIVVTHSHEVAKQSDYIFMLDSELHNFKEVDHESL